jgi:Carboxylesterase family
MWRWRKQIIVETGSGEVAGSLEYCYATGKYVAAFRGVPYAQPPVGPLRWKPPQPVPKWSDTKQCTRCSAEALQLGVDFMPFLEYALKGHGFSRLRTQALIKGQCSVQLLQSC